MFAELIDDARTLLDAELQRQMLGHPSVEKLWLHLLRTLIRPLEQKQRWIINFVQFLLRVRWRRQDAC